MFANQLFPIEYTIRLSWNIFSTNNHIQIVIIFLIIFVGSDRLFFLEVLMNLNKVKIYQMRIEEKRAVEYYLM